MRFGVATAISGCLILAAQLALAEVVVASRVIRTGEILGPADVETVDAEVGGAALSLDEVLGLEARVVLYSGRPIRPEQLRPPTLISRNQTIVMIFQRLGLRIEAEGRAMDRGSVGDSVRALNLASRRMVHGFVLSDGTIAVGETR